MLTEKTAWDETKAILGNVRAHLGNYWTEQFKNNPKELLTWLSRYKFAAKMATKNSRVLELGCNEGIGASILAEFAISYTGVDEDQAAIKVAQSNLNDAKFTFIHEDFNGKSYGCFDTVIAFAPADISTLMANLTKDGVCIVGGVKQLDLQNYFYQVFNFGMSEELVHTCCAKCEYFIQVACHRKDSI